MILSANYATTNAPPIITNIIRTRYNALIPLSLSLLFQWSDYNPQRK